MTYRAICLVESLQLAALGVPTEGRDIYLVDGQVFCLRPGGYLEDGNQLLKLGAIQEVWDPALGRWVKLTSRNF